MHTLFILVAYGFQPDKNELDAISVSWEQHPEDAICREWPKIGIDGSGKYGLAQWIQLLD